MIIVNADDFGMSELVNKAIVKAYKAGVISSTTIMSNMPAFDDAIQLAFENNMEDRIGLHFNIIEGEPLTELIKSCPRLCKDGVHFSYKRNSVFMWSKKEKEAIRVEFLAQYKKLINSGIIPTHLDSHLHSHTEIPIFMIIKSLIKECNISKIRLSRNIGVSLKVQPYKFITNYLYRINKLKTTKYFSDYESSQGIYDEIELMCHPTINPLDNNLIDAMNGKELIKKYNEIKSYKEL